MRRHWVTVANPITVHPACEADRVLLGEAPGLRAVVTIPAVQQPTGVVLVRHDVAEPDVAVLQVAVGVERLV